MKNVHTTVAKAVALLAIVSASGLASAATSDTQSLTVTGTVQAVCRFFAVPALSFTIDPSAATSQSGTTTLQYKCTNGVTPSSFTPASGALTGRTLTKSAGVTLAYDLSLGTVSAGNGFSSTAQSVVLTATVLQAAYQDAIAGAYTETFNLTINP
jgi:spore coat protein U-like protein